ncbi:hypothetical protein ACFLX2_01075 [Candidatus Dependentiae bacterium]
MKTKHFFLACVLVLFSYAANVSASDDPHRGNEDLDRDNEDLEAWRRVARTTEMVRLWDVARRRDEELMWRWWMRREAQLSRGEERTGVD